MNCKFHKLQCCKLDRVVTTADHLVADILNNQMPVDAQTIQDYGFGGTGVEERLKLFRVYLNLIKHLGPSSSKTLHTWQSNGTLLENIKLEFSKIPENSRGAYYPWLLNNQHLLTQCPPQGDIPASEEGGEFEKLAKLAWRCAIDTKLIM
jgi:hypothetical protein